MGKVCWGLGGCVCVAWCQGEVGSNLGGWCPEGQPGSNLPCSCLGRDPELLQEPRQRFTSWGTCGFLTNEIFSRCVTQIIVCCTFAYYWKLFTVSLCLGLQTVS